MNTDDIKNQTGLVDKIKKFVSEKSFSSEYIILILKYLVAGFICGFLFKTFGRFLFLALIIGFSTIWLMDSIGLISLNYEQIRSFFGIVSQETITNHINLIIDWIKDNVALFIAFCLGCYFAWEIL